MPYINGVYMTAPGTAVTVNDQNFVPQNTNTGLGAILIGPALDGQPNTPLTLSSPNQAIQTLKGGDLLQGALLAMDAGLNQLTVISPEQRTQGTSTINNSGSVAQINLKTISYGTIANSAKWMVQAGSSVGYKVSQGFDFTGPSTVTYPTQTQDNVSLSVLSLYYTGTGTSPTATITDSAFQVSATIGGVVTQIANIALSSTITVQQLVNQLNQITGLNAAVLDPNAQDATGALFDNVTNAAVSITSTNPTTLYADVAAVVRWFNTQNQYFTATRQANTTSLATSNTWTYATSGTTPTAATSDWQNAYTTAQSVQSINLITPISSSYTIWQMNDAHCKYMQSLGLPRRGYVGDTTGQSLATETAQAAILNSDRTSIVWPEQKGVDYNGNQTTFAPYLVAAQITGLRAATSPSDALTYQSINSQGIGQPITPATVSTGLAGGVIVLTPNQLGDIIVSQDRTTWLTDGRYDKVENSTSLITDILVADLNLTLGKFVGKPVTPITVANATAAVLSRLLYFYKQGYLSVQPQKTDVSLTGSRDTITGTAQAYVDIPTNYIVLGLIPVAYQQAA